MENTCSSGTRKANGGRPKSGRKSRTASQDTAGGCADNGHQPGNSDKAGSPSTGENLPQHQGDNKTSTLALERAHHPYSPSWLQSGEACPCFRSHDSKHERTIAGTLAHKATETREDDDNLSDDDAVAVAECLDFYDARRAQLLLGGDVLEGTETYLPIDDLKFEDCESTTAGYVDRWMVNSSRTYGELVDWKFGKWPVEEASNNLQGIAYTLGMFRKFPTLREVHVFFKQPLIDYVTDHVWTRAAVMPMYLRIQTIVARARIARQKAAKGDWSDARPAYPLCSFCSNVGACSKVLEFACQVGAKFHPAGLPANVNPSLIQDPQNTRIAMELASILKVWCDAFRRQVNDRVMRGDAVMPDGYQMQTMQKRQLVNIGAYRDIALKYLSRDEWDSCLDTTFSAVEKKIAYKAPRGSKESTVEEFQKAAAAAGATKLTDPFSFLKVKTTKANA